MARQTSIFLYPPRPGHKALAYGLWLAVAECAWGFTRLLWQRCSVRRHNPGASMQQDVGELRDSQDPIGLPTAKATRKNKGRSDNDGSIIIRKIPYLGCDSGF